MASISAGNTIPLSITYPKMCFPLVQLEYEPISAYRIHLKEMETRKLHNLCRQYTSKESCSKVEPPQEFINKSSTDLDPRLVTVLNKGPSYVNADQKQITNTSLLSKASLQAAVDKLEEQKIAKIVLNELSGGISCIIEKCQTTSTTFLKSKRQAYQKPPDSVVITPTDKSKRLIAIDKTHYEDILQKSTIATNNYQQRNTKLNQPRTEQMYMYLYLYIYMEMYRG